jgi:hypothetical protein
VAHQPAAAAEPPWQITLTRIAIPPALVPLGWLLCILAAVLLVRLRPRACPGL